jgi:hypothetical protein
MRLAEATRLDHEMYMFFTTMIDNEYLREPNSIDITRFLEVNVARGFFLGYLDASIACI